MSADPSPAPPPQTRLRTEAKLSGLAVASLVLGLAGFVFTCFTGIPAVICGHIAHAKIGRSNGEIGGGGIALAGLITGYLTTALSLVVIPFVIALALPVFSKVQEQGELVKAVSEARQVYLACALYASDHGGEYPADLEALVEEGFLEDRSLIELPADVAAERGTSAAFRYFRPEKEGPASSGTIMLLSTGKEGEPSYAERVVVYLDGSVKPVRGSDLPPLPEVPRVP